MRIVSYKGILSAIRRRTASVSKYPSEKCRTGIPYASSSRADLSRSNSISALSVTTEKSALPPGMRYSLHIRGAAS